jgi:inner membrane transporter RhtA
VQGAAADKPRALRPALLPLLLLVASMCAFQLGAGLSKSLFPLVGARGTAALRLGIAALLLLIGFRAWRVRLSGSGWFLVARYGAVLGLMNLCFYLALLRLPLGVVVALEFTGPLTVALWHSRRASHFFWIALAVAGLALLLPWRVGSGASRSLDPAGVLYALGAAFFWGLYIIWGRPAGLAAGQRTVALGMCAGAMVVLPFGATAAVPVFAVPELLGVAVAVAVLSSVLPYTLEMMALTRLPARVFGVSMSLEPAVAVLAGWLVLGEALTPRQYLAIAAIIVASGGAAWSDRNA